VTEAQVLQLGDQAVWVAFLLAAPVLGIGLAVGLVVSVLQAVTQINEQTLSFVPKLAAIALAFVVLGPWMLTTLLDFTRQLMLGLPRVG
jgi:flagellar biosynthetic protein FliQ